MPDQQSSTTTPAASIAVVAQGLGDLLHLPWSIRDVLDWEAATLTTDHARSSYGQPVLVADGVAYGPSDLPGVVLHWSATGSEAAADMIAPARAAGWTVAIAAYCDWCGYALTDPEARRPGDQHPVCAETAARIRAQMAAPDYRPIPVSEYRAR